MSNKLVKVSPEEKKKQEDEKYLQGRPTRLEVANYTNSLLEEHYIPKLSQQFQLGLMILQAMLIKKGICTGEEIAEVTQEFIKQSEEQQDNSRLEGEIKDN